MGEFLARLIAEADLGRPHVVAPAGLLPQIAVPVTIINGRHDRVVPLANAEFLDQRLPISRLMIIDAGHFVWEEEPAQYASAVLDTITGSWP
jgi:pimeloyl-ACP methyl ester carboxylesterase